VLPYEEDAAAAAAEKIMEVELEVEWES